MDVKERIKEEMKEKGVSEDRYNDVVDIVLRNMEVSEEIVDSIEESVDSVKI